MQCFASNIKLIQANYLTSIPFDTTLKQDSVKLQKNSRKKSTDTGNGGIL